MGDTNITGLAIPLFLVFMLLEYAVLRARGRSLHRYSDAVSSLSMGLLLLVSDALLKAYTFAVYIALWQHYRLFDFSAQQPLTWLLFFFGVDFCYYWFHRCAHEINFLWGAHVGHHQSEDYNLTTALRQSAFQYAFSWVFYLPLALLGCPPEVFALLFIALKLYQFWLHTQAINRLSWMEGWMSTPSSHRVHHAKNPIYIDRNYGGTLVVWDRLFGSWQPELAAQPCHYGTVTPLNTLNPLRANLQHWAQLAADSWHTRRWRDKLQLWFMPTGWRPEDCCDGAPPLQQQGCSDRAKFNPQAPPAVRAYVGVSFALLAALASGFLFFSPQLAAVTTALAVAVIVGGAVALNGLLEGRRGYWFVELLRWPAALLLALALLQG